MSSKNEEIMKDTFIIFAYVIINHRIGGGGGQEDGLAYCFSRSIPTTYVVSQRTQPLRGDEKARLRPSTDVLASTVRVIGFSLERDERIAVEYQTDCHSSSNIIS